MQGEVQDSPLFTEAEKLVFLLADETIKVPVDVPDELFARLQQHYSIEELVELAAICAMENFRSRFNRVFRVEANGLYCVIPRPKEQVATT
jgi:alkylhydroperoxidase family enzyme